MKSADSFYSNRDLTAAAVRRWCYLLGIGSFTQTRENYTSDTVSQRVANLVKFKCLKNYIYLELMFSRMSLNNFSCVLIAITCLYQTSSFLRSFSASKQVSFFALFKIYVWLYIILVIMLWLGLDVFREKYVVVLRQFMSMRNYIDITRTELQKASLVSLIIVYSLQKCLLFYQVPVMLCYQFWGVCQTIELIALRCLVLIFFIVHCHKWGDCWSGGN